uniref:Retrovirus-related Pol polyprotein from transposon TNT 1-94 n=1 Tax=Cajanus cajan TaxID=3821 RepID=A0A151RCN0_CAJCA|nr:Retrovirus-related Pol polyprotein from transposon TNT 1-94 [Cajanus cajan]
MIRQWIDKNIYHHVSSETNAFNLWKKLSELFESKNAQNKAFLIRKLVNLKYKDGSSMAGHLSNFQNLVNQLNTMEIVLDDELLALLLLSLLPYSWETLVASLSNSAPNGKLTFNMVKDSFLNEETKRKGQGMDSSLTHNEALIMESRRRSHQRNSHRYDDRSKSKGRSRTRKDIKCFHCNKMGHLMKDCREDKDKDTTTIVSNGEVVIVYNDNSINLALQEYEWVIDSAASFNVTRHYEYFTSYTVSDFGQVKMVNQGVSKVVVIIKMWLETNIGKLHLKNVRHIPDMRLNLISVQELDEYGYHNYFGNGKWKCTRGTFMIAKGEKQNTLYWTSTKFSTPQANYAIEDYFTSLWHKRLDHLIWAFVLKSKD